MDKYKVTVNGIAYQVEIEPLGAGASFTNLSQPNQIPSHNVTSIMDNQVISNRAEDQKVSHQPSNLSAGEDIIAPMQGKIVNVPVKEGQMVKKGQVLVVLEAMKMENEIMAPRDCKIVKVFVSTNQAIEANELMISLI